MPLLKYEIRVLAAAEAAERFRGPLSLVAKNLGSHYFTSRADSGDLLAKYVFDVPDSPIQQSATGDELLKEVREALPADVGARTVVSIGRWPDTDERRWATTEHRLLAREPGGYDGTVWSFRLSNDDGEERTVIVKISGSAMATEAPRLPEATRLARDTGGRSEIAKILSWWEPPHTIELGTMDDQARLEGGARERSSSDER